MAEYLHDNSIANNVHFRLHYSFAFALQHVMCVYISLKFPCTGKTNTMKLFAGPLEPASIFPDFPFSFAETFHVGKISWLFQKKEKNDEFLRALNFLGSATFQADKARVLGNNVYRVPGKPVQGSPYKLVISYIVNIYLDAFFFLFLLHLTNSIISYHNWKFISLLAIQ